MGLASSLGLFITYGNKEENTKRLTNFKLEVENVRNFFLVFGNSDLRLNSHIKIVLVKIFFLFIMTFKRITSTMTLQWINSCIRLLCSLISSGNF